MRDYNLNDWLDKKRQKELNQVKAECRSLIKRGFVALDTETTGLGAEDEIIQIGIVDRNGNIILDTKINPEVPISPKASRVHGMYREDVADAPKFPEIYHNIIKAVDQKTVVIYNAAFDKAKLKYMRVKYNLPPISCHKIVDIMALYSIYVGKYSWRHKSYKWQPMPGGDHSAVGDAIALVKLIYRMAEMQIDL